MIDNFFINKILSSSLDIFVRLIHLFLNSTLRDFKTFSFSTFDLLFFTGSVNINKSELNFLYSLGKSIAIHKNHFLESLINGSTSAFNESKLKSLTSEVFIFLVLSVSQV